MKFYMVFDKETGDYVPTYRPTYLSNRPRKEQNYRVYTRHRHAAAYATGMIGSWDGNLSRTLTKEEQKQRRQERFEIHEFEDTNPRIVG